VRGGDVGDERLRSEISISVGHVSALAKVFVFAATFGLAVVAARAFGVNHVGAIGIQTPLSWVWVVFFGITIAHVFLSATTVESLRSVLKLRKPDEPDVGEQVYQEIRTQNTVFLRGLLARTPTAGGRLWEMSWRDPTTMVFLGLCLLDFIAILPWRVADGQLEWATGTRNIIPLFAIGILLLAANWFAGGRWTIAISELRAPPYSPRMLLSTADLSFVRFGVTGGWACLVVIVLSMLALAASLWWLATARL
jgi:hypothetical protein